MGGRSVEMLRERLDVVLREDQRGEALELYEELERLEPAEPRWPHRRGDLLQKLGSRIEAVNAYERAVGLYSELGFAARAISMAKLIVEVDPRRADVLARLDPQALLQTSDGTDSPNEDAIELDISDLDVTIGASEPERSQEAPLDYESMFPGPGSPRPSALPQGEPDTDPLDGTAHSASTPEADGLNLVGALSAIPIFGSLSEEELRDIAEQSAMQRAETGDRLISAGDDAEALFAILEGRAQLVLSGVEAEPTVLDEGNVFGEACILDDVTHRTHVDAATSLLVLSIPKDVVDDSALEHEDMGEALLDLFASRSVASLIQTSGLFATLDGPMRSEMAKLFDVRHAEAGETLVAQGQRADGLYVLVAGSLLVRGDGTVTNVSPPAMFGQSSFLSGTDADASISSMSDALLLRLPASRFAELAALYPTVLMTLTDITARAGFGDIWPE